MDSISWLKQLKALLNAGAPFGNSGTGKSIILVSLVVSAIAMIVIAVPLAKGSSSDNRAQEYELEEITYSQTATRSRPSGSMQQSAVGVFTVVYSNSDDGFLNVRSEPSNNGRILTTLDDMMFGLGSGVLIEKGPAWSKVSVDGTVGWCYNGYLGYQT